MEEELLCCCDTHKHHDPFDVVMCKGITVVGDMPIKGYLESIESRVASKSKSLQN